MKTLYKSGFLRLLSGYMLANPKAATAERMKTGHKW
jgi:hypothetical protein